MAKKAMITVHPAYKIGSISPRLYGAFLEPIGTMVNGTMYNPKHPTADAKGFRRDFINALKATGLPAIRLPGGNFISGWDWQDSIGPMEKRKSHLDMAWFQYIPNDVGHDEYLQWADLTGAETLYTINLGTGNIKDAINIIEYTNHKGGTYWSDLRREYGHDDPYGVKIWYLGNEMDGPWQIGSWEKNPHGYGVLCNEVSKAMKWIDSSIETVVCASSSPFMGHYPQWEHDVLNECYEAVDYISLHHYHTAPLDNYAALLGGSIYFEDYIKTEIAMCDYVQAKKRATKPIMLSFDEYGSFMAPGGKHNPGSGIYDWRMSHYRFDPNREYVRHDPDNMQDRFRFNRPGDIYGALTSASIMLSFIRNADRVKIGCMTGGLGALAASSKEGVWRSASYYSYTDLIKYGRGDSMRVSVDCDTFDIPGYVVGETAEYATKEGVPFIDTAAAFNKETGELNVFAINRNWDSDNLAEIDVSGFEGYEFIEHIQLYSENLEARNTLEEPNAVVPSICKDTKYENGKLTAELKKLSWNVFRFKKI